MNPFRIVVVDDSALFRTLLRNVVTEIPGCELAASIGDGRKAIDKIRELKPDLVTLDVEMPDMNGIEVLRELKRQGIDVKVVMVSRYTTSGAQVTTDALIEGAFDFILKPSGTSPAENKAVLRAALAERISALRGDSSDADIEASVAAPVAARRRIATSRFDAVIIGCSTGGPDALARVIPDLPADLPALCLWFSTCRRASRQLLQRDWMRPANCKCSRQPTGCSLVQARSFSPTVAFT